MSPIFQIKVFIPCAMQNGKKLRRNQQAISTLAKNVRKYRKEKNLTLQELAYKANMDYSQIGRVERGTVNAHISLLWDIADALEVAPSQLLLED